MIPILEHRIDSFLILRTCLDIPPDIVPYNLLHLSIFDAVPASKLTRIEYKSPKQAICLEIE